MNSGAQGDTTRIVVVLGMHRSGTSATASSLSHLGFSLPRTLMKPQPDNPRGFFESVPLVAFNEGLLRRINMTWWDSHPISPTTFDGFRWNILRARARELLLSEGGENRSLVFKDPRLCRLLGFWRPVFDALDTSYVFVVRNPLNVAESLRVRNQVPFEMAVRLWVAYVFGALMTLSRRSVSFVAYDDLMERGDDVMHRLAGELRVDRDLSRPAASTELGLAQELRHHRLSRLDAERSERLPGLVRSLYRDVLLPALEGNYCRWRLRTLYEQWMGYEAGVKPPTRRWIVRMTATRDEQAALKKRLRG